MATHKSKLLIISLTIIALITVTIASTMTLIRMQESSTPSMPTVIPTAIPTRIPTKIKPTLTILSSPANQFEAYWLDQGFEIELNYLIMQNLYQNWQLTAKANPNAHTYSAYIDVSKLNDQTIEKVATFLSMAAEYSCPGKINLDWIGKKFGTFSSGSWTTKFDPCTVTLTIDIKQLTEEIFIRLAIST